MTSTRLSRILNQYSPTPIVSFTRLKSGFANDSYLVTTDSSKKYVIKVLRTQSPESVEAEAAMQAALQKQGIATPVYVRLQNGKLTGSDDGLHFVISTFIEGSAPKKVNKELASSIGQTLARIHDALNPASIHIIANQAQWLNPQIAQDEIMHCPEIIRPRLQKVFDQTKDIFELELPKAIIHGDVRLINLFAEKDNVTAVFDFETTEYNLRILDISQTYLTLANDKAIPASELLRALSDGYNAVAKQPLSDIELASMGKAIKYTAVACGAWGVNFDNGDTKSAERLLEIAGV